jgi:hypothetical protein
MSTIAPLTGESRAVEPALSVIRLKPQDLRGRGELLAGRRRPGRHPLEVHLADLRASARRPVALRAQPLLRADDRRTGRLPDPFGPQSGTGSLPSGSRKTVLTTW